MRSLLHSSFSELSAKVKTVCTGLPWTGLPVRFHLARHLSNVVHSYLILSGVIGHPFKHHVDVSEFVSNQEPNDLASLI